MGLKPRIHIEDDPPLSWPHDWFGKTHVHVHGGPTPYVVDQVEATEGDPVNPGAKQWLFTGLSWFREAPAHWRKLPPKGGLPVNVWGGLEITRLQDIEAVSSLRKIRARRLFLVVHDANEETLEALEPELEAWRCMHCGRRGDYERPDSCPTGSICFGEEDLMGPQIHWLVDCVDSEELRALCERNGVSYWGRVVKDRPV